MIETGLKAGDVFFWKDYSLSTDEIKSRWFLYLGNQTTLAIVYQITTTTKLHHYEPGGIRAKNNHFAIPARIGGLERDSVLDLTLYFRPIHESVMNGCKSDIEKKGILDQDYANRFVRHLKDDAHIPRIMKKDICRYLGEAGFNVKPI